MELSTRCSLLCFVSELLRSGPGNLFSLSVLCLGGWLETRQPSDSSLRGYFRPISFVDWHSGHFEDIGYLLGSQGNSIGF